jgi:hypothetical protein
VKRLLALVLLAGACSAPAPVREAERPAASGGKAAALPALAEAVLERPRVRVQVTDMARTGPEAVSVKFRLLNTDRTSPASIGDAFADTPGDFGSLSGVYLLDGQGTTKLFVLRDDRGQAQCSTGLGPIPPGGQAEAWARFPAPPPAVTRLTVQVPGLPPFRDLPVAEPPGGTGPARPSY